MFGPRHQARAKPRDEAEKPFWISYADLMTALMVLFLVVMAVALLAITKTDSPPPPPPPPIPEPSDKELLDCFQKVVEQERFKGITINRTRKVIDFGSRAQFPFAKSTLTPEQQRLLRSFVPAILEMVNDKACKSTLKQIVVDGFTDKKGTYLSNLDLSLQRSQRVLCALFAPPGPDEQPMTPKQLAEVRAMFVVGGYSFNAQKATDDESRRIEMRLQFFGPDEKGNNDMNKPTENLTPGNIGTCALPG